MSKIRWIKQYENLRTDFEVYFKKTSKDQDIEDIHQLRVAIKKMRAVWALLEMATKKSWKKDNHIGLTKKLFNRAGEVREAQVNLDLIKRVKTKYILPFKKELKSTQKSYQRKLQQTLIGFRLKDLKQLDKSILKLETDLPDGLILKKAASFIFSEFQKIDKFKPHLPDQNKLHKIRIHLKSVREILNIIQNIRARTGLKKLNKRIKSVNELIGIWHDYYILINDLKKFFFQHPKENKRKALLNYISRLEKSQIIREQKLYILIEEVINLRNLGPIERLM